MIRRSILLAVCSWGGLSVGTAAKASEQLDLFEVAKVNPSRVIKHDVTLQGRFDAERVGTDLKGPECFSHPVGTPRKPVRDGKSCLNWYRIMNAESDTSRMVSVRDDFHGGDSYPLRIGSAQFLLSPATSLTSGPPAELSEQLNYFVAYRIDQAPEVNRQIELNDSLGPKNRQVGKAAFLCVPVEEWHHHEHFPIKNQKDCFVVYTLTPDPRDAEVSTAKVSTIDQFGLNQLTIESSVWLAIPAEILSDGSASNQVSPGR